MYMHSEILHLHSHRLLYYVAYLIAQAYTLVEWVRKFTVIYGCSFAGKWELSCLIPRPLLASFPLHILQLVKNWMVGRPAIDLVASFPGFCVAMHKSLGTRLASYPGILLQYSCTAYGY